MILMLIRALDIIHMVFIPMDPDDPVGQQRIMCASASHRVFEKHGVAHGFVGSCVELVEEGGFHVAGEFLWCVSRMFQMKGKSGGERRTEIPS
jgi:hypothetical protein